MRPWMSNLQGRFACVDREACYSFAVVAAVSWHQFQNSESAFLALFSHAVFSAEPDIQVIFGNPQRIRVNHIVHSEACLLVERTAGIRTWSRPMPESRWP